MGEAREARRDAETPLAHQTPKPPESVEDWFCQVFHRALGSVVVTAAIFFTANAVVTVLLVDWRPRFERHIRGGIGKTEKEDVDVHYLVACALIYILCTVLMYLSWAMASSSDPGVVPADLEQAREKWQACCHISDANEVWDFCEKSRHFIPPRAGYSNGLGRCVLQFEHYSFLVNNCIGACNHRYFVQVLFYLTSFCFMTGLAPWPGFSDHWAEQELDEFLGVLSLVRVPADAVHAMSLVAFPTVLGVLLFKLWMMCWGLTGKEFGSWMSTCCPSHVHDRGLCANWTAVMGSSPVRWFLPLLPPAAKSESASKMARDDL